jgi:hypothetical protein
MRHACGTQQTVVTKAAARPIRETSVGGIMGPPPAASAFRLAGS